ncbi:hypothetical protein I7I51_02590 [Histoplasma capsulatum]|uniref:Uncharacterized protein n=1 Tax=Ajellomyces capsulatus TaxID=5037 RepID=A0A8A1MFC7_AJECA|nr:predicted protein [Histoplasma mississippiense (nom. inval.)]EDN04335.1 predicted protein [Histoplasma mississippiense (nom. inval.)]QSS62847.1 hypothetical protein I7I51_02590 [Histoplasma capsulatum]
MKGGKSTSLRSSHAETAPPSAEKPLRKSERSVGGPKKSPAAIGIIGSPLVSSRRVPGRFENNLFGTTRSKRKDRPEGVTKPQASRKGKLKLSRFVKHDAIATALRDVEQQATQKTSKESTTAPKADTRRERRTQPRKSNSKPSSQSRPQGIIKSQARKKGNGGRPPRAAKINALAREAVL